MPTRSELRIERARLALAQQAVQGAQNLAVPYEVLLSKVSELINSVNSLNQKVQALEQRGGQPSQDVQPASGFLPPTPYPNAPMIANESGQSVQTAPDGSFQIFVP
jgi:hypothetical protein